MIEVQNFLKEYPRFRKWCDGLDYDGEENPADGLFYPGVSLAIPTSVKDEVKRGIEVTLGREITVNTIFLRLSVAGVDAPHQAHTDSIMGQKSLMLYLNRPEHCRGGTSFVRHWSGFDRTPLSAKQLEMWENDHSNPDQWQVLDMCEMESNKACIFDANLMHRAEPVGGFGSGPGDGRLVLTVFFNEHS